ncbi:MAG: hypothetical protein KDA65_13880 [Planctomycetaceae bacterium]|nr:hypothetical protein [Planctomycetaceae bacterium]
MNRFSWWIWNALVFCHCLMFSATHVAAEQPRQLQIVLTGSGELELAPHGVGNIYAPEVIYQDGLYQMWYGAQGADGHDRILYAESKDGLQWDRRGVAIDNGDSNHVNDPTVVVVKGKYYMHYTRAVRDVIDQIDVAVSEDGKTWEHKGVALKASDEGAWDSLSVGRPTVLYERGLFHLWYDGRKDFSENAPVSGVPKSKNSRRSVGYAISQDGLEWTRFPFNPVFENNAGGIDVARIDDSLIMLYESGRGTCLAESASGTVWEDRGLFIPKTGQEDDAFGHVTPHLVAGSGTQLNLYVGAAPHRSWNRNRIGLILLDQEVLKPFLKGVTEDADPEFPAE